MKHRLFFLVCFLSLLAATPCTAARTPDPGDAVRVIETLNAALLTCMKKGEELGFKGRYDLLEPVMRDSFFYEFMVRKSTGSAWKKLTPAQQKELLGKYITWSVGTYAGRFGRYRGQQFTIVDSRPFRERYMKVTSRITRPEKKPRDLTYLLVPHQGRWQIIDIRVEGVSQLSQTRSQFRSVLKKEGIEGLLRILDDKIRKLESGQ